MTVSGNFFFKFSRAEYDTATKTEKLGFGPFVLFIHHKTKHVITDKR